jgi:hypothetical protein
MTNAMIAHRRRATRAAFAALALASAVACTDDPVELEDEPDVVTIIVGAGSSQATINHAGSGTQTGSITLTRGQANTVTFRFVGANGQDDDVIADDRGDFELRAGTPMPTSVTFTPTAAGSGATFTATITPTVAGQVSIPFQLYNSHHGHAEIQRVVTATVQ